MPQKWSWCMLGVIRGNEFLIWTDSRLIPQTLCVGLCSMSFTDVDLDWLSYQGHTEQTSATSYFLITPTFKSIHNIIRCLTFLLFCYFGHSMTYCHSLCQFWKLDKITDIWDWDWKENKTYNTLIFRLLYSLFLITSTLHILQFQAWLNRQERIFAIVNFL